VKAVVMVIFSMCSQNCGEHVKEEKYPPTKEGA